MRSEEGRKTIMEALPVLSRRDPQQLQERTELRQWVATTATPPAPALAEASAVDTHFDEVLRKRRDTLDGLLAKFEFNGEVKLA